MTFYITAHLWCILTFPLRIMYPTVPYNNTTFASLNTSYDQFLWPFHKRFSKSIATTSQLLPNIKFLYVKK